jgi:hypothetical protein
MWKFLAIFLASLVALGSIVAGYAWYIFRGLTYKERARLQRKEQDC